MGGLRSLTKPFIVSGPAGVAVRTRLKHPTPEDEKVLELVGAHLGSLASKDLKARCQDGLEHSADRWAVRKRELTALSSSRWAGSITKATHDQWALARRCQSAQIQSLQAGIQTIAHRLSLPVGARGSKKAPGGYRSRQEWHAKARRMHVLEGRLERELADRDAGVVHVTRGGKRLARTRHHLDAAQLTDTGWRRRWEAERWFLAADGESGKRYGNETIRVSPDGEVSIKLPAPLADLANAKHGRYVLDAQVNFPHRGPEWADRVEANRAVAYRIHYDVARGRWYLTASWQYPLPQTISLDAGLTEGVIGVDMNTDHLAAWRLDAHGNPTGDPRRFFYDLSGNADHRDAQVRHALTRLLHWAKTCGVQAIAVEDLDFGAEKTREKHGRKKRFRQLISGMPTGKLRARLTSMADQTGIAIIAVDPAYTSRWGAQHWQKPLTSKHRRTTRHDAASIAIGRRAQGHPIRRRTAPPPAHRSDVQGHRTVQADRRALGREGTRPRIPGPRTRSVPPGCGANVGDQRAQHRSGHTADHEQLMFSLQERYGSMGRRDVRTTGRPPMTAPAPKPEILAAFEAAKGFMPVDEGLALYAAAVEAGRLGLPLLEVGTYCGRSAILLADAAREAGVTALTVDHHRGSEEQQPGWEYHDPETVDPEIGLMDTLPTFRRTLHKAGLEDHIVALVGRSPQVAAIWNSPLGLVFIDGGHTDEHANADYEGWAPHVAEGGLLLIHDVHPDPKDEFTGQAPYRVYLRALSSGAFTEVSVTDTLRVLRRTGAGI